jgi:signal transduction histidine kinase
MSLRLRLSLLVALGVALGFLLVGALLRVGLEASLLREVDRQLERTLDLADRLLAPDPEEGSLRFSPERGLEVLPQLLPELILLLVAEGEFLDSFGRPPRPELLQALARGEASGYRVRERVLPEGLVLRAALPLEPVRRNLVLLDGLLLRLLPAAFLLTLALAYGLLGRGLRPLDALTRQALRLAQERAWTEKLAEPGGRDEVWRLARAVNVLLGALGEVIQSERRFTEDASHALRTPLTLLLGRLERALAQAQDPVRRELLQAQKGLKELLLLTERLLQLARAEAGGLDMSPLPLDALAFEEAERMRERFLRLDLDLPEESLWVLGDETALRASIQALLENALRHGGGRAALRVYAREGRVHLEVADWGPGLEEARIPQLFQRFYRGPGSQGSGLGLALVSTVVRWHGGEVWARNRPEGGALFGFSLPSLISVRRKT